MYIAVQDFRMPIFTWLLPPFGAGPACSLPPLNVTTLFLIQVTISSCDLLVVSVGQMSMSRAINLTQKLWTAGITAEIMYDWSQVVRQKVPMNEWNANTHDFSGKSYSVALGSVKLSLWFKLPPVFISVWCSNKLPQTSWFKASLSSYISGIQRYKSIAGLKLRCLIGMLPSEDFRGRTPFLA